jgi:MFS family permease
VLGSTGDRVGNRLTAIFCFVSISATLFWLSATTGIWPLYTFAIIYSLGYGGFVALQSPMVAELFGLGSHGVIMGSIAFGSTIGGAVGPVLSGYLFDLTNSYSQAFLLCAILAVIGLILVWLLRPIKAS